MRRIPAALAALACLSLAVPARAEENGFANFFSHLFGGPPAPAPKPTEAAPPRPSPAATHKSRKKREATQEAGAAPATRPPPPKTATKFVYLLGDSLAISVGDGMAADLADNPDLGVIDRARDASGLVREDYFDWGKAARDLAAAAEPAKEPAEPAKPGPAKEAEAKPKAAAPKEKIDLVVVLLGINDMQQMRDGKDYVDPLSDRWRASYTQRIQAVVAPFVAAKIPVIWVGLPPMRSEALAPQRVAALNEMFKQNAEKAGAQFLDITDDFADQSGGFDAYGPNMEGQRVRLRSSDGIHFTSAGGKKVAHFIDEEVRKALGAEEPAAGPVAALPPDIGPPSDINEQIRREGGRPGSAETPQPAPEGAQNAAPGVAKTPGNPAVPPTPAPPATPPKPEAGAVASLTGRPRSAGGKLATPTAASESEWEQMLKRGEPPAAAPGRADDFSR